MCEGCKHLTIYKKMPRATLILFSYNLHHVEERLLLQHQSLKTTSEKACAEAISPENTNEL